MWYICICKYNWCPIFHGSHLVVAKEHIIPGALRMPPRSSVYPQDECTPPIFALDERNVVATTGGRPPMQNGRLQLVGVVLWKRRRKRQKCNGIFKARGELSHQCKGQSDDSPFRESNPRGGGAAILLPTSAAADPQLCSPTVHPSRLASRPRWAPWQACPRIGIACLQDPFAHPKAFYVQLCQQRISS